MEISPKYLMTLIDQVEKTLWDIFPESKYKNVKYYIKKWHEEEDFNLENFKIYEDEGKINLKETLHGIDSETLIKIAIDLGIETPDFIPAIPVIKNVLRDSYSTAFDSFQKALKQIEENQDLAVGLANSTLESIIKHILENDNIPTKLNKKNTLYDLAQSILKEFSLFPDQKVPNEIRDIGSGLLKVAQNIEKLRSEKTTFHGKAKKEYIIKDILYAYFVVNAVSTTGLFLMSFYEKKYNNADVFKKDTDEENSEINIKDIPF